MPNKDLVTLKVVIESEMIAIDRPATVSIEHNGVTILKFKAISTQQSGADGRLYPAISFITTLADLAKTTIEHR